MTRPPEAAEWGPVNASFVLPNPGRALTSAELASDDERGPAGRRRRGRPRGPPAVGVDDGWGQAPARADREPEPRALMLLVLKVVLVPMLIGAATLAGRRWGPRLAGWLTGLPIVAGPVLLFFALEQGTGFAARAALSTLVGLGAVAAFCVTYGWTALHAPWLASLAASWAAFAAVIALLGLVAWPPWLALGATTAALLLARRALPVPRGHVPPFRPARWDLPVRMLAAVTLVLTLTALADRLGPRLAGLLVPFPVALAVLLAFAHADQGPAAVTRFLAGFLGGFHSFGLFCFVLAVGLPWLGIPAGFAAALLAQLVAHGLLLGRAAGGA